ncbi:hypothetical protein AAHA92_28265 [Salvia divinorum]|uniref:Uncharacterized protein n=1 Tax=Salvia divinorum TaxID=28513 RepID=A0ABD1FUJ3_SALDI
MRHLERQKAKIRGSLSCGGIITLIATCVGVDVDALIPLAGEMAITLDVLQATRFWRNDRDHQGFFLQKAGDHFFIPDAQNTYVNGWTYRDNWLMNRPVHQQIISTTPRRGWRRK